MNEHSKSGLGKISVHGNGMGAPTPELIEKRAREIAIINERHPNDLPMAIGTRPGVNSSTSRRSLPPTTPMPWLTA